MSENDHVLRYSDSSWYDVVCVNCGTSDHNPQALDGACSSAGVPYATIEDYYDTLRRKREHL